MERFRVTLEADERAASEKLEVFTLAVVRQKFRKLYPPIKDGRPTSPPDRSE